VKRTFCEDVPSAGITEGSIQLKVPEGMAAPPERVEEASVCPYEMALAEGHTDTMGVPLSTCCVAVPVDVA